MSEYIITDEQIAENRRLHGKKLLVMPVIVRCRDCKHYKPWVLSRPENGGDCVLNKVEVDVWFDGFCAWGERREQ